MAVNAPYPDFECKALFAQCCGMGRGREYAGSANVSMPLATFRQEEIWNLPHGYALPLHGASHHLVFLAARLLADQYPEMHDMVFHEKYQCDVEIEQLVVGLDQTLDAVYRGDFSHRNIDVIKDEILGSFHDVNLKIETRGITGAKGAFYLGRHHGKTIEEVKAEYKYSDPLMFDDAGKLEFYKVHGDSQDPFLSAEWMTRINHGDSYEVNGEVQTYRDYVELPMDIPAYDAMLDLLSHFVLFAQDELIKAENIDACLEAICCEHVVDAMLGSSYIDVKNPKVIDFIRMLNEPPNPHNEIYDCQRREL